MDMNPELATNLRQWRDDQQRWRDESQASLDRLTRLSLHYRAHASQPDTDPYNAGIQREVGRIDELTKPITATEHLIGLADEGRLANPNA
ncbi:hypothetical protein LJR034_009048 [Caballeronia sp. LjRoot34]|uniref:hypothetical protein n=1 Tax=Caballeronia sp. LjRoot34 TaxID=3342325 RepID=UPI003ED08358